MERLDQLTALEARLLAAVSPIEPRTPGQISHVAYDGWADVGFVLRAMERFEAHGLVQVECAPRPPGPRRWVLTYKGGAILEP